LNPFLCATERTSPHIAVFRALEEGVRAVEEDTSLGLTAPVLERHPKRSAKQDMTISGVEGLGKTGTDVCGFVKLSA
jgi:hypothetical protein